MSEPDANRESGGEEPTPGTPAGGGQGGAGEVQNRNPPQTGEITVEPGPPAGQGGTAAATRDRNGPEGAGGVRP